MEGKTMFALIWRADCMRKWRSRRYVMKTKTNVKAGIDQTDD
jgi:hypothetical protein